MKPSRRRSARRSRGRALAIGALALLLVSVGMAVLLRSGPQDAGRLVATYPGSAAQAEQFAAALRTPVSVEARRRELEVLGQIAAPCCSGHRMSGRCCGCLLSRAIGGLVRMLAGRAELDVASIRRTTEAWIQASNPGGYTGRACAQQRCSRPFREDGCGGEMTAGH